MKAAIEEVSPKPPQNEQCNGNSVQNLLDQMARAFGKDGTKVDEEAGEVWKKLTELHESDPIAYQSFIRNQMEDAENHSAEGSIIPKKGFVVKAFTKGFKVFINFCKHDAIRRPVDDCGEPLHVNASIVGIEIPLVVSELRTTLIAHTIDVVLHPWCLQKCSSNTIFKSDIVRLGIAAIEEDRNISVDKEWKFIKSMYKGGVGPKGDEVHPLPVGKKDGETDDGNVEKVMENPSTLLQSLHISKDDDDPSFSLKTESEIAPKKKTKLIQEIGTIGEENETMKGLDKGEAEQKNCLKQPSPTLMKEVTSTRKKSPKECPTSNNTSQSTKKAKNQLAKQMKGFLNRGNVTTRKPIYEQPSICDGTSGEGGTHCEFLSKCNVVNVENPVKEEDKGLQSSMKKGFLNTRKGVAVTKRNSPDTNSSAARDNSGAVNAQTLHQLILDVAVDPDASSPELAEAKNHDTSERKDDATPIPYSLKEENRATVLYVDLSGTRVSSISDVAIESIGNLLTIATNCGGLLRYHHPCVNNSVSARMKQKKRLLVVTIPNESV